MLFDIVNPSDPYTMEASCLEVAAAAVCLLGQGKFALNELTGDKSGNVPAFLTGGHNEWFTKQFGRDFEQSLNHVMATMQPELIKAFGSVFVGDVQYKRTFEEEAAKCDSEEEFAALLEKRHDAKRTSMNDIGRQAWSMADALMAKAAEEMPETDGGGHA